MADRSEIAIQTLFRSRCRILCPGVSLVAVPNAGKRTQWAAQLAKREGLAKGFPDLIALAHGGLIAFLGISGRRQTHGKQSLIGSAPNHVTLAYSPRTDVARPSGLPLRR